LCFVALPCFVVLNLPQQTTKRFVVVYVTLRKTTKQNKETTKQFKLQKNYKIQKLQKTTKL
tara:strand:+ start:37 stop:219 length:183 start_codon:yes stop_codon:yes gene_type:complete